MEEKQVKGYNLIDLGLPSGTLWMDRNVGASSPTEVGMYFALNTAKGYYEKEVEGNMFTKEWYKSQEKLDWTNYKFEDGTHVPTIEQIQELKNNCYYQFTSRKGVLFTSKINGNSIFVPTTGFCWGASVYNTGGNCCLWSSSLPEGSHCNWYFYIGNMCPHGNGGLLGIPVRSVVDSVE